MTLRFFLAASALMALSGCGQNAAGSATKVDAPSAAAKTAPAGKSWVETVSKTDEGGVLMGNPDAAIKVIEYGARTCPTCARFDTEGLPELKSGMIAAGKVSYEFRDFPVHGALDLGPILLGHCVEPAQFFPMLDEMMRNQPTLLANESKFTPAEQAAFAKMTPNQLAAAFSEKLGYLAFVKQRGVPEDKARACLADKDAITQLAARTDKANQQFSIGGTPTFIINGKVADGVLDWAGLKAALAAAGA